MTSEPLEEEEKPGQEEQNTEDTSKNENLEKEPEEVQDQEPEVKPTETKTKIPVTEYGIKSGEFRCAHCARAYKFFQVPKIKRYFNYKYADLLLPRNRKVSEREGIDEMPFFKVKRPGSEKFEFIVGFNEVEWEEMIEEVKGSK